MSHWHYQLMKHTEASGEVWYGVHEMFPSVGNLYTTEPVRVLGESLEDVKWQLKAILGDLEKYEIKEYESD